MEFHNLLKINAGVSEALHEELYGRIVEDELRKNYSQRDVEAIINNYLAEPDNEEYIAEFNKLQECRKAAKATAKAILDDQ